MKLALLVFASLFSLQAFADSPFRNLDNLKRQLGFDRYYDIQNNKRPLRIAVLDKGFDGYATEIGRTLPAGTRYVPGPVTAPPEVKVEHGFRMAQILTALMTDDLRATQWAPQLTLYNVFGFSNFKAAVDDLIAKKVDLVLYSEVWEYGGNFDGKGFINAQVNRATAAGVIWVNAAGNFGLTTYNGRIRTLDDNWVELPDRNHALALKCEENQMGKCPVKIVLSWNDFKDNIDVGTNKDLDLALTDDLLNIVQTSALKQTTEAQEMPGASKYPREILAAELKPGTYYLRVKNRSNNFTDRDQFRITVDGESISMPSHSNDETILNPADNATVITVGASDSDRSAISNRLHKPDLMAPSSVTLQNGDEFRGSSNSAAIVAAGLALLKTQRNDLKRADLLSMVRGGAVGGQPGGVNPGGPWNQGGLSLNQLRFGPTGPGCFVPATLSMMLPHIQSVLARGGVLVQTTAAIRIMVPYDPITLSPQLRRQKPDDMVVITPQGIALFPRLGVIPPASAEIFQRPQEAGLCSQGAVSGSGGGNGKSFRLP